MGESSANAELYGSVDSIVNIAAISGYTNAWIGGRAPNDYIDRILALGTDESQLRRILEEHFVRLEDLHPDRWQDFYTFRLSAITDAVAECLTSPV